MIHGPTPKGDISFLKNPFSRTTTNGSFGLQSCFPVFVTSQIVNPAYGNSNGWRVGRTLGWALHVSKSKPVIYHCISDGNQLFSENFWMSFSFHLAIMSDKAAFVRGALFCVQRYRRNLELFRSNSASLWQTINLPSKTPSKLFANHNALGQLTNHYTFRFSEGGPSSNPELIESFVWGGGERYCNNVNYVKNNAIFEPPSMRACSSTPPKQNQDFVKENNRTPLTCLLNVDWQFLLSDRQCVHTVWKVIFFLH